MKSIRIIKSLFWCSVVFLTLWSMTFSVMQQVLSMNNVYYTILLSSVFYITAIIGYFFVMLANAKRRWCLKRQQHGDTKMGCRAGIITFFSNIPAIIFDILMGASILLFVVIMQTEWKFGYVPYVLLSLVTFSLNMHCLFNGRIYKYITTKTKENE